MKYRTLDRPLCGDYGNIAPNTTFEVPDDQNTERKMRKLEEKGLVMRFRPPIDRKAYTVYQNKALRPSENK